VVTEKGHALEGQSVKDRVLIFPRGKGSTVGSYTMYRLKKNGVAPAAIVNVECEPIVAVGAIISDIPAVDKLEKNPLTLFQTGKKLKIDADRALIEVSD